MKKMKFGLLLAVSLLAVNAQATDEKSKADFMPASIQEVQAVSADYSYTVSETKSMYQYVIKQDGLVLYTYRVSKSGKKISVS